MSDDEFDFSDDILDQDTLAALDAQEEKFLAQQEECRPAKRQKVDHPAAPNDVLDDLELPEVSLDSISFAQSTPLPSVNTSHARFQPPPPPLAPIPGKKRPNLALRAEIERALSQQSAQQSSQNQSHTQTATQASNHGIATSRNPGQFSRQVSRQPGTSGATSNIYQQPSRTSATSRPTVTRNFSAPAPSATPVQRTRQTSAQQAEPSMQMDQIMKEVERLKAENQQMVADLKEAETMKLAKEGEVTVLRKSIEKTNQAHQASIATLKNAKSETDARLLRAEKEYKAELERVRTEGMFKQQEARGEAMSVKKEKAGVPLSARVKRTGGVFATPSRGPFPPPMPPQTPSVRSPRKSPTRRVKISDSPEKARKSKALPGFMNAFDDDLLVSKDNGVDKGKGKERARSSSPSPSRRRNHPSSTQDAPMLDLTGFDQPSSSESPHHRGIESIKKSTTDIFGKTPARVVSSPSKPFGSPSGWNSGPATSLSPGDEDSTISQAQLEEEDDVDRIDWKAELTRLVLTHTCDGDGAVAYQPTLQRLMSSPLSNLLGLVPQTKPLLPNDSSQTQPESQDADAASDPMLPSRLNVYSGHLKRILDTISLPSYPPDISTPGRGLRAEKDPSYTSAIEAVSTNLVGMVEVLLKKIPSKEDSLAARLGTLAALFNLLKTLCYALPCFAEILLRGPDASFAPAVADVMDVDVPPEAEPSRLVVLLCRVVTAYLEPSKTPENFGLGRELTGLLEALCWYVPDDVVARLAPVVQDKDVLPTLLHHGHPLWMLTHTTRFLALAASHKDFVSRSFLPPSDPGVVPRVPYIDRLCFILVDLSRQDAESLDMKAHILTFWAMLSVSGPDISAVLTESHIVIPSLVLFLTHLTAPLWERDGSEAEVSTSARIRTLAQSLFLLHHLICAPSSNATHTSNAVDGTGTDGVPAVVTEAVDFRQKLHHAPHQRPFTGIAHMFVVTFGRLSFADPPGWVDQPEKDILESVTDIAQELLGMVVDGPELDSVWSAYQDDSEEADEGEMESQLLSDG